MHQNSVQFQLLEEAFLKVCYIFTVLVKLYCFIKAFR